MSWTDIFGVTVLCGVLAVIVFFWRGDASTLQQSTRDKPEVGKYADPKLGTRIRRLNALRWGLLGAEISFAAAATATSRIENGPQLWWPVFLLCFAYLAIGLYAIDHRRRKLMTKGMEQTLSHLP